MQLNNWLYKSFWKLFSKEKDNDYADIACHHDIRSPEKLIL